MPIEYAYDERRNFLQTRFFGTITDEDIRKHSEAVAADPRIRLGLRELVDLTDIEEIRASSASLELIIKIDMAHSDKFADQRTAIIAPTNLLFGYARMYQTMVDLQNSSSKIGVFRTPEEAKKWLGPDYEEG